MNVSLSFASSSHKQNIDVSLLNGVFLNVLQLNFIKFSINDFSIFVNVHIKAHKHF